MRNLLSVLNLECYYLIICLETAWIPISLSFPSNTYFFPVELRVHAIALYQVIN